MGRFQVKHVAGVDNSLADLIIHYEHSVINAERKPRRPDANWREQVMRREEKYPAILRGDMRSDMLRRQLE